MAILGAPPTLEWIDVTRLSIDPVYQRTVEGVKSKRIIAAMQKDWDWSLCQVIVVSRRADGSVYVLDGQHRLTGARQRGDIPHLPCVILSGRDRSNEAATFVALNTKRQKLSQADIFFGMLASGDAEAAATAAILEDQGGECAAVPTRSVCGRGAGEASQSFQAGDLACAPMLIREVKLKGEAQCEMP